MSKSNAPRWADGTIASIPDLECVLKAFGYHSEAEYERMCKRSDEKHAQRYLNLTNPVRTTDRE